MNVGDKQNLLNRVGAQESRARSSLSREHFPAFAAALLLLAGCSPFGWSSGITGSGRTVTQQFDFAGFSVVAAGSTFQVEISQGEKSGVAVTADDNLAEYLDVTQSGDKLRLFLKPNVSIRNATLKAVVTMPVLTGLQLSGASRTKVAGFSSDKKLHVDLSGASSLRGDLKCGEAWFGLSGASRVDLRGSAENLRIKAGGASHVNFEGYRSKDTVVDAGGASRVTVNASGRLEAEAGGASSVRYVGEPASVKASTSGASSVKQR